MKYVFPLLLIAVLLGAGCHTARVANTSDNLAAKGNAGSATNAQLNYISQFKNAAVAEMERSGIPASIILAQGMLESSAGQSELAQQANNHFGIKCSGGWTGKTFYKKDDEYQNGNLTNSCFRKYSSVAESYYDHAEFLHDPRKNNRYGFLFNLDRTDYKGWANGLQSSGYATSNTYANQLIDLIDRYQLYNFDRPGYNPNSTAANQVVYPIQPGGAYPSQPELNGSRIGRVNDVKVVLARPGQNLDDIARSYNISTEKVVDYNDRGYSPGVVLPPGTRVYIQCKKDRWRGISAEHFVREGQTMFDIAQQYGVKLDKLRERNGLLADQEPATGEKILLRGSLKKGAAIRLRDIPANPPEPTQPAAQSGAADPKKMTTGEDMNFVIGGNDPKPAATGTQPANKTTPAPAAPATPATTGTPYPPADPAPVQNTTQTTTQPATQPATRPAATPATAGKGYHMVVKGDTLYNIARRYATTVAKLKQMNKLPDDNIKIGQTLKVN